MRKKKSRKKKSHSRKDLEPRGYSVKRIKELSKPKESKQVWMTNFGPHLYWGNQDMMWPISKATLNARPTQRLIQLATAKRNFQTGTDRVNRPQFVYSCGRHSEIWEVSKPATRAPTSERIKRLATPKVPPLEYNEHRQYFQYGCGRESPIWSVNKFALTSPNRPRTAALARPKDFHPEYQGNKEVETVISYSSLYAKPSERVQELSSPKYRHPGPFVDSRLPEDSIWKVSPAARAATASPRVAELAKHKPLAEGFVPNRGVQWPVSRSARRALTTPRCEELSKPIIRASMDNVQFNPEAFFVKPAAKTARCTPRLEELAQPIQR